MESYEKEMSKAFKEEKDIPQKINLSILKYFWQANPITGKKSSSIPRFLRNSKVLKNFSDYELKILVNFMHQRKFDAGEVIFNQGDLGIGFYFVFSGYVTVFADRYDTQSDMEKEKQIAGLEKGDYFGELSLLQDRNIRNGKAVAKERTQLLGLFKPDLEELINLHPIVAAKLLQSISLIVTDRLMMLTTELKRVKYKLDKINRKESDKN